MRVSPHKQQQEVNMSNNPDDQPVEELFPDAIKELDDIHGVYNDVLAALVASCKKRRVLLSLNDIQVAMEGVGEALADEADHALETLRDAGYSDFSYIPEDSAKHIADAHENLVDDFRLKPSKPFDIKGMFNQVFTPRPFIQNPQTHSDMGAGV
jgi:hypothetical protein